MAGGVFSGAKLYGMTIRESANDGSDFTTPDADYRRLFLGEDGNLYTKDAADTVAAIGAADVTAHTGDATDAHDASAISVLDTAGHFDATEVEAALAEAYDDFEAHVGAADPHTGYVLESLLDAKGDIIAASADNTPAKVTVGTNGSTLRAASGETAGIEWQKNSLANAVAPAVTDDSASGYTVGSRWIDTTNDKEYVCLDSTVGAAVWTETTQSGSGGMVGHDEERYVAGNITLNNTSWTDVSGPSDLVVAASAGDLLLVGLSCRWAAEAVSACLDMATIVSASPVNYVSGGGGASDDGVSGWFGYASLGDSAGAPVHYAVQAGDISGGNVTLRLRYRTTTAANKTLYGSSVFPLQYSVINMGQ